MTTDRKRAESALRFYKISSRITGALLIALLVIMILRYGFVLELWAGGPGGPITLVPFSREPGAMPEQGFSLAFSILQIHGLFYVVYLFADFRIWTLFRWSFLRFLVIASGGVVPLLSFFTENHFAKVAHKQLEQQNANLGVTN